jgi:hypothetical protein
MRSTRVLGLGLCMLAGCGADAKDASDELSWGGEEPHLRFTGSLDGEKLDVDLSGDELEAALFNCALEYEVEAGKPETARMVEAKINALLESNGQSRMLELELKYHDLTADAPGDSIDVVPREDDVTTLPEGQMVCEWEWQAWDEATQTDTDTLLEVSAQKGKVTLHMFEGLPVEGPAEAGKVTLGATVNVSWSVDEAVQLSFTALCGEVKLTEI